MSAAPAAWDVRITDYDPAVPLDQLLAHPANPKIHPRPQTDALKGILGEVGWLTGLVVNRATGYVLDGHDRIKAAMEAGQTTAPVFYVNVPADQEPYVLATFDPVGALAGQDAAILAELLAEVQTGDAAVQALLDSLAETLPLDVPLPGAGGDEFDGTPQAGPTRVQPGDLFQVGPHRLLCGDSTNPAHIDRLLAGARPDALFGDPPFDLDPTDQAAMIETFPGPVFWLGVFPALGAVIRHTQRALCYDLVWHTINPHFPGNPQQPISLHKNLFIFAETMPHVDHSAGTFLEAHRTKLPSIWNVLYPAQKEHGKYEKPIKLTETLVRAYQIATLFVPFLGTGTDIVAAHRAGVVCYGCELDPVACDTALRRAEAEGIGPIARVGNG